MFSLNDGGLFKTLFPEGAVISDLTPLYITYIGFVLVTIIASYLIGSLNSSIIISKLIYHDDIRNHGSGNAGLTNTLRTYGLKAAGLTLLGDMLKTAISILIAAVFFGFNYIKGVSTGEGFCYVAGLFSVIGHVFPIWHKFKGGKGVLSTATMVLILAPIPFLILLAIFALIVYMSKYVSLGSICGAGLFPLVLHSYFMIVLKGRPWGLVTLSSVILAALIIWCHRANIVRIQQRTERKLSFKKKPEVEKPADDGDKK